MSQTSPAIPDPRKQLRREMGFWDVLLFNIATVLGPRWIAAAAHNGTSSISLWIGAAVFFFVPTALVIVELSTRFPEEGGLYVWSKQAFGEFHGFVAGWTYWIYTVFYFPGLAAGERIDERLRGRFGRGASGAEPHLSAGLFVDPADCSGVAEHYWIERGQVAAKCGRRGDVSSLADAHLHRFYSVVHEGAGDAFHLGEYFSGVELGYRKFLAADRVRVYWA